MKDRDADGNGVLLVLDGAALTVASVRLAFGRLTARALLSIRPDEIACALFTDDYDAAQVVQRLEHLGYRGLITVIAPPLPRPRMVEQELRHLGPGARLRLLCQD